MTARITAAQLRQSKAKIVRSSLVSTFLPEAERKIRSQRSAARSLALREDIVSQVQKACAVLPEWVYEYRFDTTRRWRADIAYLIPRRVIVEIDGGIFSGGRHTRGAGFEADQEKLNEAMCQGWAVIRISPKWIKNGRAAEWIVRCLQEKP